MYSGITESGINSDYFRTVCPINGAPTISKYVWSGRVLSVSFGVRLSIHGTPLLTRTAIPNKLETS